MKFYKFAMPNVWNGLWLVTTFVLFLGACGFFFKFYEDAMRSRERGRLVASIVHEQMNSLAPEANPHVTRSQDVLAVEQWMIEHIFDSQQDPTRIGAQLRTIMMSSASTDQVRATVLRWTRNLDSWVALPSATASGLESLSPKELLSEGRKHYFEAAGYRKIGRSRDAAVLNLWTIAVLSKYIEKEPFRGAVPEALFMLGDAYLDLGKALPARVRSDRLLNLCSEMYPDSIWASRANMIWKEEQSREARDAI